MADYIYTMEIRLTPDQQRGVTVVQDVARAAGMNIYLTGGAIRDIISGFTIRDLDFTVQGNPLKLQKELERAGAIISAADDDIKPCTWFLPGACAPKSAWPAPRRYEKTGKPPIVAPATIIEDLRRRDFTVNAMALSLNPGSRGLLMDPFNGAADIEAKLIRVLHNYAFVEDPSRLIRATPFRGAFPLATRRAYAGALRLGQRKQVHRAHQRQGYWAGDRATRLRRRSAAHRAGSGKGRLAEGAESALEHQQD